MLYRTTVALGIKGDRVEAGTEVELTPEQAMKYDPADLVPVDPNPPEPEPEEPEPPIEEMTLEQLKARAKALELSASGSKADILERINLHMEASN